MTSEQLKELFVQLRAKDTDHREGQRITSLVIEEAALDLKRLADSTEALLIYKQQEVHQ